MGQGCSDVQSVNGWHYVAVSLIIGIHAYYMFEAGVCIILNGIFLESRILRVVHLPFIRADRVVVVELVEDATCHRGGADGSPSSCLVGPSRRKIPVLAQTLRDAYVEIVPAVTYGKVLPAIVQYHPFTVEGAQ